MPSLPRPFAAPLPTADELCELLQHGRPAAAATFLDACSFASERSIDVVVLELAGRGFLEPLLIGCLRALVAAAQRAGLLGEVFAIITGTAHYETLRHGLAKDADFPAPLYEALVAARPSFGERELNAPAREFVADIVREDYEHDVLIVPGYTPLDADRPIGVRELPIAQQRLELAAQKFREGLAPLVLLTGGSVHPAGTTVNEALSMREYLVAEGVPAEQILVEPYARHTTTNLRNAGRLQLELGLPRGLVVTGFDRAVFDQAFYLSYKNLSTFADRCRRELGYVVGRLTGIDDHRIAFEPSEDVFRVAKNDPWDA